MGNWIDLAAVLCAGFVLARVALRPGVAWKRAGAGAVLAAALVFGRGELLPALLAGAVIAAGVVYGARVKAGHKRN